MTHHFTKEFSLSQIQEIKIKTTELIKTFYEKGLTLEGVHSSVLVADKIVDLVKSVDFIDSIKQWKDYRPIALTHPFMVSVLSVMICRRLDWNADRTLRSVSLGGILHNVGMIRMPENVKNNHPDDFTKEEQEIYKTHPEVGFKIAGEFSEIPAAVLQIIFQHHELNGKGFPFSLTDLKIYPLAKVVCLADRYARFIFEKDSLMHDGLKPFLSNKFEIMQHDPDLIRAMIKSFIKDEKTK
jgi:HD-GYP domain-containing protein (c-di-GMP phosphodiesterase class II)